MKTTFTRAELDQVVSTIEADIRHAETNETSHSVQGLHHHAADWKARQVGLADARVRVLTLLQS